MNPLDQYPQIRRILYVVQWATNLLLGIASVVLIALGDNPMWWVIVQAVFNFVWSYTGLTAQRNVDSADSAGEVAHADNAEPDYSDLPTDTLHGGNG